MVKVKSDRSFNEQQEKWLELIKRHFIENLLMEKEETDYLHLITGLTPSVISRTYLKRA